MADTRRSLSEVQTLLADNTTGAISAQDLRDMLKSLSNPHGTIYINSSAATTISGTSAYYKAAGTTTGRNMSEFDMPENNRLRYTGAATVHVHVAATLDLTTASNSQVISMRIVKNGDYTEADAVASEVDHKTGTGTDIVSTAIHYDTMMSTNDYLEVWVKNETSATTVTLNHMYLFALGMIT